MSDVLMRQRITEDFSTNFVVEAGAGTGKTTLLVERALQAILRGHARIDQLVMVTFMERASVEIRQRLSVRIDEALREATGVEKSRLMAASRRLDQATITTIHGLGQRILSEFSVPAGVPIGFTVLDGVDAARMWSECWYAWLGCERTSAQQAVIDTLMMLGERIENLQTMAHEAASWEGGTPPPRHRSDLSQFLNEWRLRWATWSQIIEAAADDADPGRAQVRQILDQLEFALAMDDKTQIRLVLSWEVSLAPKGNQKNWKPKERLREQKQQIGDFKEALKHVQAEVVDALLMDWLQMIDADLRPFWRDFRWRRRALLYDDLLREARDVLRRDPEVRRTLYARWRIILVDEFQDTDRVQSELIFRLASNPDQPDWERSVLPPGRLFLVGDMKQSIYRFRGADVETFQTMRAKVARDGGAIVQIDQNFRSDHAIIEVVNAIFQRQMPAQPDLQRPYLAFYHPLTAIHHHPPEGRIWSVLAPASGGAERRRRMEAEAAADLIQTAIHEGWPVRDRDSGVTRPAALQDIAVLIPNRTGIGEYREVFRDRGVPLASLGGVGFFHQDEVRGFSALLSLIDDPDDEVSWLAFFLSPWVGASHLEILKYREAGGRFGLPGATGSGVVAEWCHILQHWLGLHDRWLPVDFFDALAEESALIAVLASREDHQALANLRKLRELCRQYGPVWGLDPLNRWLAERIERGDAEAEGTVAEIGNAVQLSTVHQAKGLEWPICVVTNWHLDGRQIPRLLRDGRGDRVAWRTARLETDAYAGLADGYHDREAAEQLRLWYVALTRARDYLLLVESFDPSVGPGFNLEDIVPAFERRVPNGAE